MSNQEDEIKKRKEAFEKEQKLIDDFFKKRKEERQKSAAQKKARFEVQAKRQAEANKQMEALVSDTLSANESDAVGDGAGDGKPTGYTISRFGGMGGLSGRPLSSEGKHVHGKSAPQGAVIPGLAEAREDREKNKKYGVSSGGRFTSNTSTGKSGIGTSTGGGSTLRKGLRF